MVVGDAVVDADFLTKEMLYYQNGRENFIELSSDLDALYACDDVWVYFLWFVFALHGPGCYLQKEQWTREKIIVNFSIYISLLYFLLL